MSRSPPSYRAAMDEDATDLIRLVGTCFAEFTGCFLDVPGEEPVLYEFATHFERSGGETRLAVSAEGLVVGMIAWSPKDADTAELKKLYVDPGAQRQGIGKTLVSWVIERVATGGRSRLILWTDTRFEDAHRLYERHGFTRQPELRTLEDLSNTSEAYYILDLSESAA